MTLDDLLPALFPDGHAVRRGEHGTLHGKATGPAMGADRTVAVLGAADGTPLGVDGAILLAGQVLDIVRAGGGTPILMLVDTASQRMARRDELLGLNEYLAHLCKCLALAARHGHRTAGLLYGHAAAGAFIATALATQSLAALPGAEPSVMDLPSIARVTKLRLERLQEMARATPVFAPGLDPLARTGAIVEVWDPSRPLPPQLAALLARPADAPDTRDALGRERGGRLRAAEIAARVRADALRHG